jgi:hypothetical protein
MYLIEYIKQTQADFPLDSTSPVDVLTHLLYTNGNGVEFVDGNPVVVHDEGLRHTSFKDWYSHVVPFQDIKDRLNQDWNVNKQVKDYYNSITGMQQRFAEIKGEEYDADDLLKIYKTDIKTLTADISKMADI